MSQWSERQCSGVEFSGTFYNISFTETGRSENKLDTGEKRTIQKMRSQKIITDWLS